MGLLGSLLNKSASDVVVKISADSSQYDAAMEKTSKSTLSWSTAMTGASVAAVAAFAGAALAVGAYSVKMASNAQEIDSKFNIVFGNSAKAADKWADDFGNAVGRANMDVKRQMSTFQDTFVPLGFAREEAARMSETLTVLTADLASFNNTTDDEALRALQSALVGNHETMRKYGVIITQTTLEQELMNMGIVDGMQAATEQEKVQARLNIIMRGTTDAQGDAIRTADSFANQTRALSAEVTDLAAEFGQALLPAVTELFPIMIGALNDVAQWGRDGGFNIISESAGVLVNIIRLLVSDIYVGVNAFQVLFDAVMMVSAAMHGNIDAAKEWYGALKKNIDETKEAALQGQEAAVELIDSVYDLGVSVQNYAGSAETATEATDRTADAMDDYNNTVDGAIQRQKELRTAQIESTVAMDDHRDAIQRVADAYGLTRDQLNSLTAAEQIQARQVYERDLERMGLDPGASMNDAMMVSYGLQLAERDREKALMSAEDRKYNEEIESTISNFGLTMDNLAAWAEEQARSLGGISSAERGQLDKTGRQKFGYGKSIYGQDWWFSSKSTSRGEASDLRDRIVDMVRILEQDAAYQKQFDETMAKVQEATEKQANAQQTIAESVANRVTNIYITIQSLTEASSYETVVDEVTKAVKTAIASYD